VRVALACTIRINGLFVAAGVFVLFLMTRPGRRDWSRSLAAPLARTRLRRSVGVRAGDLLGLHVDPARDAAVVAAVDRPGRLVGPSQVGESGVAVSGSLMTGVALLFFSGQWAG